MPDVIIYHTAKQWLVLIEAVTSHGPIDPKRRQELKQLFGAAQVGLVYVTTFLTRAAMREYLAESLGKRKSGSPRRHRISFTSTASGFGL